jgi:DNA primase
MALSPGFLDELRSRLQVSDVVGKRVPLQRGTKGEFKACCPFHKEKSPSFTVNDQKGFFHCFGCGAHGDVIGFVMQHDRLSFMEAIESLSAQAGLEVPKAEPEDRERFERQKSLYDVVESACAFFEAELHGPGGRAAREYLKGRGLDGETVSRFRLGFAPTDGGKLIKHLRGQGFQDPMMEEAGLARRPDDGRDLYSFFRNRVMFPVADRRGRTVAFGGRIMEGDGPKYINSPDNPLFHKGQLLYGMSRARQAASLGQTVIVAEGYMDVIALVKAGFEAAVAPLGTAMTEEQIAELWKMTPSTDGQLVAPVCCFDGDAAGQRAAYRAADRAMPLLTPGYTLKFAFLPEDHDPDSFLRLNGSAAFKGFVDNALSLIDLVWRREVAKEEIKNADNIASLKKRLIDYCEKNQNFIIKRQYIQEFSDKCYAIWRFVSRNRKDDLLKKSLSDVRMMKPNFRPKAEAMLLGISIRYPEIFGMHAEELHKINYVNDELFMLLQSAINNHNDYPNLSGAEMIELLRDQGESVALDIISKDMDIRLVDKSPDNREKHLRTFEEILARYFEINLTEQIRKLAGELGKDFSRATWDMMQALRKEVERVRMEGRV